MTGKRRERLRAELEREAKAEARRLTASHGIGGLSLSAVARAVGVTPPALYRYFDGKKGLALAVYEDVTAEFVAVVAEAVRQEDQEDLAACLYSATRAAFDWSVAHPAEYDLLTGAGYARLAASLEAMDSVFLRELGGLYASLFGRVLKEKGFDYPADDELAPDLARQLAAYRRLMRSPELPLGVTFVMISCWRQIYGLTCMAVYGHLATAFDDCLPLFDRMLDELLGRLGLTRTPGQT
ncbi:TetR/AcrR family transcriptional regulator [Streptomyces anthocyanicus]|uniref:TetR/AcrR family transcriptional regulator n=1 Tax=Streptomyces anthocyanicus TaxID=68174 RepID=UPI0036283C77